MIEHFEIFELKFQFHLKRAHAISLYISVDSNLPNLESKFNAIKIDQLQTSRKQDHFIPEDLDPLSAPMTRLGFQNL